MKIGIVGAGFSGIAAAWDLVRAGHEVTVLESSDQPGGLASGFHDDDWDWSADHHYHHIFSSDDAILDLCKEMGCDELVFFESVVTSTLYNGQIFRLDSPISLLTCPQLSLVAKLRTAATLAFLRFIPAWKILEKITAVTFLKHTMGEEAYRVLWKGLFHGKFAQFSDVVNAAWFWARIYVRSPKLGYFKGGFMAVITQMVEVLQDRGVTFMFKSGVTVIEEKDGQLHVEITAARSSRKLVFDKVLVTAPSTILHRIVPKLGKKFTQQLDSLQSLGATTLVMEMDQPFFSNGTYWLSVNEEDWPFLAVVEHTQLTGSEGYNGKTILYVGKYCSTDDPHFSMDAEQLFESYRDELETLSPSFAVHVTKKWVFKTPFAQPVVPINHSKNVPSTHTPIPNLYWASMQHIYPFDRGTNYAVALGRKVAAQMLATV